MEKDIKHRFAIEAITYFYQAVGEIATRNLKLDRKLQLLTLIISTLTSGALWTLIAIKFEDIGAWLGAVATTLTTGLAIYQSSIGPGRINVETQILYEEIGEYLAKLASAQDFDELEFRNEARRFESKLRKVDYNHPILYSPAMLGDPDSVYRFWERVKYRDQAKTK